MNEERQHEKTLYAEALQAAKRTELVIVGTPTGFQKARSMVVRFVRDVQASSIGLFCAYFDKVGTTLTDLEAILEERDVRVVATRSFAGLKPGQFTEIVSCPGNMSTFRSRCISSCGVARRLNISGDMRPPRALQDGRLAPLGVTTYFRDRTLDIETREGYLREVRVFAEACRSNM